MTQQQNTLPQQAQENEVDIIDLVKRILKEWKLIFIWAVISGVIGLVIALSSINTYKVSSSIVPEVKGFRNTGNLSSLASLAGININGAGSGSDVVSPLVYPEIVGSTLFATELFDMPVTITRKKETIDTDLYTYFKEYQRYPWWSGIIALPGKAIGAIVTLLRPRDDEGEAPEGYVELNPAVLTKEQARIVSAINRSISLDVDSKIGLLTFSVTTQDADVSLLLCKKVIENLEKHLQSYRTEKARIDLDYYQQLYDESKEEYHAVQQRYAAYLDANQGVVLQRVLVERERLRNEGQLAYQLYMTCAQQLQVAKAAIQEETPVCVILNPPSKPMTPSGMTKFTKLLVITFLGVCCACAWVLAGRSWLQELRKK